MRSRGHMSRMLFAAASLLATPGFGQSAEVIPRRPEDYPPDPKPPKVRRYVDMPTWARNRQRKLDAAERQRIKKAGISGAGLWRKTGRRNVRGW